MFDNRTGIEKGLGILMSENRIGSVSVQVLFDNSFDHTVGTKFKKMKSQNCVFTMLDLSHDHLGERIALRFADILIANDSFTNLSLASCQITDVGGFELVQSRAHNTFIRTVNLRDDFLSRNTGFDMVDVLLPNEQLTSFDLS
jgi:hypothetical protein